MHLLEPLSSGIAGAESGTVDVYQRGTTTRATYYTAFDGSGATTPTGSIALDANGAAVLYVNEICDVIAKDSNGVIVHTFTASPSAAAIEVISRSFTGVDYATGASAASKPTDLQTVLDRLYTSFGARDFNLLVGGASTTVQAAFAGLATLYFNVKSSAYGATGDGSTDDTSAIQAAMTAANASGGIVFFPQGTYRITSTVTVGSVVSILGTGPAGSVLNCDAGLATSHLAFSAGATYTTSVAGMRFSKAQSNNGAMFDVEAGRRFLVENCFFDCAYGGRVIQGTAASGSTVFFSRCGYALADVSAAVTAGNTTLISTHFYACKFVTSATAPAGQEVIRAYAGSLIACEFDVTSVTSGTLTLVDFFAGTSGLVKPGLVVGCYSNNPTGGTVTAMASVNGRATDGVATFGNRWGSSVVVAASTSDATAATYFGENNLDRLAARYYVADDTAAVSAPSGQYAEVEIVRTTNGNQTVTLTGPGPIGLGFTLVYHQSAGGASGTITMAGNVKGLTTFTVNATSVSYYFFRSVHRGTSKYWALVGSAVNQTA